MYVMLYKVCTRVMLLYVMWIVCYFMYVHFMCMLLYVSRVSIMLCDTVCVVVVGISCVCVVCACYVFGCILYVIVCYVLYII